MDNDGLPPWHSLSVGGVVSRFRRLAERLLADIPDDADDCPEAWIDHWVSGIKLRCERIPSGEVAVHERAIDDHDGSRCLAVVVVEIAACELLDAHGREELR